MKRCLVGFLILCAFVCAGAAIAEEGQVVEVWTCTLKDGKTIEDVKKTNSKWLKAVNEKLEGEKATSYVLETLVGSPNTFGFIDAYPTLEAWAAAKRAGESSSFDQLDAEFAELSECTSNSLHRSTES